MNDEEKKIEKDINTEKMQNFTDDVAAGASHVGGWVGLAAQAYQNSPDSVKRAINRGTANINENLPGAQRLINGTSDYLQESGASELLQGSSMFSGKGAGAASKGAQAAGTAAQAAGTAAKGAEAAETAAKGVEAAEKGAKAAEAAEKGAEIAEKAQAVENGGIPTETEAKKIVDNQEISDKIKEASDSIESKVAMADSADQALSGEDGEHKFVDSIVDAATSKKTLIIIIIAPILFLLILILIPFAGIMLKVQPILNSYNYIVGQINYTKDLVTKGKQSAKEKKYYKKLQDVQKKYKSQVCIDINLITSALTEESDINAALDDENKDQDFARMGKYVDMLANMQLTHKKYILNESADSYCREGGYEELVTSGPYDSSTAALIAMHDDDTDVNGNQPVFSKRKADNEKNYVYYYYYPDYEKNPLTQEYYVDKNGNKRCTAAHAKLNLMSKNNGVKNKVQQSIGTFLTMDKAVFYWNLINSFVPDYYDSIIPDTEPEKLEKIDKIAYYIYLFYDKVGPGQNCNANNNTYNSGSFSGSGLFCGPSDLCPNGIDVEETDGKCHGTGVITNHELEEYVAGVVQHENAWDENGNIETMKAQAVAARTYALKSTGNCSEPIMNDQCQQTYMAPGSYAIQAAAETAGQVMTQNGSYASTEYDALCVIDIKDGTHVIRQKNQQIPSSFLARFSFDPQRGLTYADIDYCFGHGRGMSQMGARYLQHIGYNYSEILNYYYDGIEITNNSGNNSGVCASCDNEWKQGYEAPWAGLEIGRSGNKIFTMGSSGCLITSQAMIIAKSGIETPLGDDFNPGTYAQAMMDAGFIDSEGNSSYYNIENFLSNFKYYGKLDSSGNPVPGGGGISYQSPEQVAQYLSEGFYIMLFVPHGGSPHYVVICDVDVDSGEIYVNDPAGRVGGPGFVPESHALSEARDKSGNPLIPTTLYLYKIEG